MAERLRALVERVVANPHTAVRITDAFLQALMLRVFGALRPINMRVWTTQRVADALTNALRVALFSQDLRLPRFETHYNFVRLPVGSRAFWEALAWCIEAAVLVHEPRMEWRPRTPSELQRYLDVFVRSPARKHSWPMVARSKFLEDSGVLAVRHSPTEQMSELARLQNAIVKLVEAHVVFEPLDLAGTGADAPIPRAWAALTFVADAATSSGYTMSPCAQGLALMHITKLLHKERPRLPMQFVRTCLQGMAYDTAKAVRATRRSPRAKAHYLIEDLDLVGTEIQRRVDQPSSANMPVIERAARRVVGVFLDLLQVPDSAVGFSSAATEAQTEDEARRDEFFARLRQQLSAEPRLGLGGGGGISMRPPLPPTPATFADSEEEPSLEGGGAMWASAELGDEHDWEPAGPPAAEAEAATEAEAEAEPEPEDLPLPLPPTPPKSNADSDADADADAGVDLLEGGSSKKQTPRRQRKLAVRRGNRRGAVAEASARQSRLKHVRFALGAGWGSELGSAMLNYL